MLRKTIVILFCALAFFGFSATVTAQILSPSVIIQGDFQPSTTHLYIGEVTFQGQFHGFSTSQFQSSIETIDSDEFTLYPFLTALSMTSVDNVYVIDLSAVTLEDLTTDQLQLLINSGDESITRFQHVTLSTTPGLFLFGSSQNTVDVSERYPFAVTGQAKMPFFTENSMSFVFLVAEYPSSIQFSGEFNFLMQPQGGSSVVITNSKEEIEWQGDTAQYMFLLDDNSLTLEQASTLQFFPISAGDETYSFTITPASTESMNVTSLFNQVSSTLEDVNDASLGDITESIEMFEDVIDVISSIVNGGMVVMDLENQMIVDGTTQLPEFLCFVRGDRFHVQKTAQSDRVSVTGNGKLVFIDDHFFTLQAPTSDTGITFPILFFIIWALAITVLVIMKMYVKKEENTELTQRLRWFALIFHIILIVVTFILIDGEINYQFGVSALSVLTGNGNLLIMGVFFGLQLLMWTLGYFLLALPMGLMLRQGFLYFFGFGKKASGFSKGISLLFIWVFTALFVKLFINVVLLFLNPSSMLPM